MPHNTNVIMKESLPRNNSMPNTGFYPSSSLASGSGSSSGPPPPLRRPSRWSQQLEQMLSQGRRNSAARLINSISGWAGGGPIFPTKKTASFAPDVEDHHGRRKRKQEVDPEVARQQGNASMGSVVSALYAKLLVVMGCGFPLAEVISSYIPQSYYDGFYLYLYFVSILFMTWIFANVIQQKASREIHKGVNSIKTRLQNPIMKPQLQNASSSIPNGGSPDVLKINNKDPEAGGMDSDLENSEVRPSPTSSDDEDDEHNSEIKDMLGPLPEKQNHFGHQKILKPHHPPSPEPSESGHSAIHKQPSIPDYDPTTGGQRQHFGSFYLRIGAVAFGIGSMIYSGLEFGQYFELDPDEKCHNYMIAITPCVRMIFTFMQMYFIFLNSRMAVSKVSLIKQFGLMHLIGTNLCVWLNVLVQETKHEISHFYDPITKKITLKYAIKKDYLKNLEILFQQTIITTNATTATIHPSTTPIPTSIMVNASSAVLHRVTRTAPFKGPHSMYDCGRVNIIGSLVDSASPFLFPCTIEYSLICAAICYVMWKSMAQRRVAAISLKRSGTTESLNIQVHKAEVRSPHHYTVDCAGSNKGFFIGIFFLVITIMSLILNFVFMKHEEFMPQATFVVNITEVILYSLSVLAVLLGMCRFRQLRYVSGKNLELDNILLIVAQSGSFVFNVFCIIGGHLTKIENDGLVLIIPIICLIQLCLQTLFILDASKRVADTPEQLRRKPGREIVTFLLVTNLAMWLVNALEKSQVNSHPYLLHFYGVWAWTIITRISMPLAIFYRFHSTVCLCEIWKKAYKVKREPVE